MKFDWQLIAVVLIVAAAFLYAARRGLARLRSFGAKGGDCATGCGKCGDVDAPVRRSNVLTQLGRPKGGTSRRG